MIGQMNMNKMPQMGQMSQKQLLHFIDMVSLQVVDTTLFLDSHPQDEEAIKNFNYYKDLQKSAMETYASLYGPLTIETANPTNCWTWATTPWPWEGGNC